MECNHARGRRWAAHRGWSIDGGAEHNEVQSALAAGPPAASSAAEGSEGEQRRRVRRAGYARSWSCGCASSAVTARSHLAPIWWYYLPGFSSRSGFFSPSWSCIAFLLQDLPRFATTRYTQCHHAIGSIQAASHVKVNCAGGYRRPTSPLAVPCAQGWKRP